MLEELHIQNFAIIDRLELHFSPGFNVITGETGAGKSIIIDAVDLLLGGKSDPGAIRSGAERAIIEGVFALDGQSQMRIQPVLERESLLEPGENLSIITLSRELRSSGRSAARVNGVTVNSELLRELGESLIDIHGQSAHLSLFRPRAHIDLLDRYANLLEVRSALAQVVESLRAIQREIISLEEDKAEIERRAERLRYEVQEIEAAELDPDEEEDMLAERNRLANSEQLARLASEANALLSTETPGDGAPAVDQLGEIAEIMARLARIDPTMAEDAEMAEQIAINAQELAVNLARYAEDMEFDPDRLNELEERLELIKTLKRRYRVDSIAGIIAYGEKIAAELEKLEHSDVHLNQLRDQEEKTLRHIGELCLRISRARVKAGEKLAAQVVRELQDLRMERARFEVSMIQHEDLAGCYIDDKRYAFDATGMDDVEFMMSANPGEPVRPLAKVASGGEAARIMLALKRVLTLADQTPTLIFDEIDQGIGGRIGAVVGEKLWTLSDKHQVLVVTHLAQLAGYGDQHYQVAKEISGQRTLTHVHELEGDDSRIQELAAMLGAAGDSGMQSARELLDAARTRKRELRPDAPAQQRLG